MAARFLGFRVRILLPAWMSFVSAVSCKVEVSVGQRVWLRVRVCQRA
jgi:hypothetical protein